MRQTRALVVGAVLGAILSALALCVYELNRQLSLAQTRLAMVESANESMEQELVTLRTKLDELQRWRTQVTAASRMGWSQAHRFIREFPLIHLEAE